MPLEFATVLHLRSAEGPTPLEQVVEIAANWADVDAAAALEGGTFLARENADARAVRFDTSDGRSAWMLRYAKPDGHDGVVWVVEISAAPGENATPVSITLRRESSDSRLRPLSVRPAPPRIVRDLVGAQGIDVTDGPVALELVPRRLDYEGIGDFVADCLMNPDRGLPVVAITEDRDGRARVDPNQLSRSLLGLAHVWIVSDSVTWGLSEQFSDRRLAVHSGAVRLWWPGLEPDSWPFDHPLWLPELPASRVTDEVTKLLWSLAVTRFRPIRSVVEIQRTIAQERRAKQEQLIADLRRRVAEAAAPNVAGESTAEMDELAKLVTMVQEENAQLRDRSDELELRLAAVQDESAQFQAKASALQYALDTRVADQTPVPGEPGAAFLREVEDAYRSFTAPGDRDEYPLRRMEVGNRFLESLDRLLFAGGIDRPKVVRICAEVACGRAHKIIAREVHQLRAGDGGNSPTRTRSRDGALAWRCSLQVKTPQARRLHWWALPGGGVEFAWCGLHDDLTCPE